MPVRWTPNLDQILLLKVLETHPELKLDTKKVAETWPTDLERPTPRAIYERLAKLRKEAGAYLAAAKGGKGDDDENAGARAGLSSAPTTPKKSKFKDEENTPGGSASKRKRQTIKKTTSQEMDRTISDREVAELQAETTRFMSLLSDEDDDGCDEPRGVGHGSSPKIKHDVDELASPSKRPRVVQCSFDKKGRFKEDEKDER